MEDFKNTNIGCVAQAGDDKLAQLTQLIAEIGKKSEGMENWIRSIIRDEMQSEEFTAAVISIMREVYSMEVKD